MPFDHDFCHNWFSLITLVFIEMIDISCFFARVKTQNILRMRGRISMQFAVSFGRNVGTHIYYQKNSPFTSNRYENTSSEPFPMLYCIWFSLQGSKKVNYTSFLQIGQDPCLVSHSSIQCKWKQCLQSGKVLAKSPFFASWRTISQNQIGKVIQYQGFNEMCIDYNL